MLLSACSHGGYRVVSPESSASVSRQSYVVLYGVDPGAPAAAPPDCEKLAQVEVWGKGEKAYHFQPFRAAAQKVGGNGVTGIERTRIERGIWGDSYHYRGTVVQCPPRWSSR